MIGAKAVTQYEQISLFCMDKSFKIKRTELTIRQMNLIKHSLKLYLGEMKKIDSTIWPDISRLNKDHQLEEVEILLAYLNRVYGKNPKINKRKPKNDDVGKDGFVAAAEWREIS